MSAETENSEETGTDFLNYRKEALEEIMQSCCANEIYTENELFSEGFAIEKSKFGVTFTGNLYKCKMNGVSSDLVAKVIGLNAVSATIAKHLREEGIRILRYLCRRIPLRNLLDIYEVFLVAKQKVIIIEETPDMSLITYINNLPKWEHLNESRLRELAKPLANAINYLHSIGIAHQNIAPHNIYFTSVGTLKLATLEYASISWDKDKDTVLQKVYRGNVRPGRFVAPEVTTGNPYDPFKADMYSYGVTLFYVVLKKYPYESTRSESFEKQWNNAFYDLNVFIQESITINLLRNCTEVSPDKRYDIQHILTLPFFRTSL